EPVGGRSVSAKPGRFLKMARHGLRRRRALARVDRPFFGRGFLPVLRQPTFGERPVVESGAERYRDGCAEIWVAEKTAAQESAQHQTGRTDERNQVQLQQLPQPVRKGLVFALIAAGLLKSNH